MENLSPRSHIKLATFALLGLLAITLNNGCDQGRAPVEDHPSKPPQLIDRPLDDVQALKELDLTQVHSLTLRRLEAGEAQLFAPCRELFEENGRFLDWPFDEDETPAALFGCDPEASLLLDDGSRFIAYATDMAGYERATDLQILSFDPEGVLLWHHKLDRSDEAPNFTANFRGSFLTAVGDNLICAGTLWQGSTQAACIRRSDGEVVFDGPLKFWAGMAPFGFDGSLFSTDINGITRRYPFRGTEMRHRELGGRGGRAAFYATDEERIFFVPAEDTPYLSGWDLLHMRKIWQIELPRRPRVSFSAVSAHHRLLLLKLDDTLYGFDTKTGEPRFVLKVGSAHPPVTFSEEELFLLLRRDDEPPLLYALDPQDGTIRWSALAPSGTLHIAYDQGLLSRSVRAVRQISPIDDDGPADE